MNNEEKIIGLLTEIRDGINKLNSRYDQGEESTRQAEEQRKKVTEYLAVTVDKMFPGMGDKVRQMVTDSTIEIQKGKG